MGTLIALCSRSLRHWGGINKAWHYWLYCLYWLLTIPAASEGCEPFSELILQCVALQAVDAYRTCREIMSFSCCDVMHGKLLERIENSRKHQSTLLFSHQNLVQGAFEVHEHGQLKMPLQHRRLRCDRKYWDRPQLSAKLKPMAVLQRHKPCAKLSDLQFRKICKE